MRIGDKRVNSPQIRGVKGDLKLRREVSVREPVSEDVKDSVTCQGEQREFIVGVNYWPRKKAMYMWKEFDPKEIEEDFRILENLGIKYVRIFLLWEDFQPKPDEISESALKKLQQVLDIADKHHLKVMPTLVVGFMSGLNWVPKWALDKTRKSKDYETISDGEISDHPVRDIYEDPEMLEAQKLLVRTVVSRFKDHPAIWAWDLSNEVDNLCKPKSSQAATNWVKTLVEEIKRYDKKHPVTLGTHQEDIEKDKGFHIDEIAKYLDIVSMHGYSVYASWAREPLDSDVVPFALTLTSALAGKKVLFEEFGVATSPDKGPKFVKSRTLRGESDQYLADEKDAARYYSEVLEKLYRAGALGAMAWMFADYDKSIWNKPPLDRLPHERFFGLIRADGTPKALAKVLSGFASRKLKVYQGETQKLNPPKDYYSSPMENLKSLYAEYLKATMRYPSHKEKLIVRGNARSENRS